MLLMLLKHNINSQNPLYKKFRIEINKKEIGNAKES